MQHTLVKNTGLDKVLDATISVDSRRVFKPNPRTYELIEETIGIKPQEVLFVSSNPFDVSGAKSFGLNVAWIERVTQDAMAQAFKPDFDRFGVSISVINPGFVKTPATDKNSFEMPFLIGVDEAVDHIVRGIAAGKFEISFPWQMSFLIHLLALLPNRLKFAITRGMLPR